MRAIIVVTRMIRFRTLSALVVALLLAIAHTFGRRASALAGGSAVLTFNLLLIAGLVATAFAG